MYVCICHAVTDTDVHDAVDAGAATLSDVGQATRAGQSCATCHDSIEDLIAERCMTCPLASMQVA